MMLYVSFVRCAAVTVVLDFVEQRTVVGVINSTMCLLDSTVHAYYTNDASHKYCPSKGVNLGSEN